MPILFRPLETAPEFYTRESEERFRRELENYLLRLSSEVNGASSAQSTEASLSSKRESLILSPTGEKTYSVNDAVPLERSYYMGTKTVASTTASMAGGGAEHWVTPTSWTARQADEWAESGGECAYSGAFPASGSRRFLVSYTSSFSGTRLFSCGRCLRGSRRSLTVARTPSSQDRRTGATPMGGSPTSCTTRVTAFPVP